jgi:hypothetical protein
MNIVHILGYIWKLDLFMSFGVNFYGFKILKVSLILILIKC